MFKAIKCKILQKSRIFCFLYSRNNSQKIDYIIIGKLDRNQNNSFLYNNTKNRMPLSAIKHLFRYDFE